MITDYTSYDEIRSVLGVEDDELLDVTIEQPVYLTNLLEDMYEVSPEVENLFETISNTSTPTPLESRFLRVLSSFATYSVARQFTSSLPMFAPRSIGDGKATMSRFADPYKETIKRIEDKFTLDQDKLQQIVDEMLSETREQTPHRVFFGVGIAYDPVTGEST